jgi:iron complex outermembrane receptor protein
VADVPGGADVVDAEIYERGRVTTLKDALDFAPGVFVQPRFGAEEARLSIRGSGIQRTFHGRGIKLLQDGVPLNLADGGFDFQAVEPLAARYVEVYRGANALEYGSTTLGGAINFVTHTGYNAAPVEARLEMGSFGTLHAQSSSGIVSGPFDAYMSLSELTQDGFREHSQQNNQRLFSDLGYRINPNLETRFYVTYVKTASELPGNLTKEQLEDDPRQAQRNAFAKQFDYVDSDWQRNFSLFRLANTTAWVDGGQSLTLSTFWAHKDLNHPILFVIDQLSNDFGADLRYENHDDWLGQANKFTLGFAPTLGILEDARFANVLGRRGAMFADSNQTSANLDLYLQDRYYFAPRVALVLGGQVSYAQRKNRDKFPVSPSDPDNSDTQSWWGLSPKAGLLWDINAQSQAYLNVSRSFEPPSFGELTNPANNGASLVQLDAQRATTVELGTRGQHGRYSWDLALYRARMTDELTEYTVLPGTTQTVNADKTIHEGIEAGLDVELLHGVLRKGRGTTPDQLVWRQVYLWNHFRFDGDRSFGNNALPGIPGHYYRSELVYEHPCGFYAGPNVEWVPRKYNVDSTATLFADPYALLGFKAGYRVASGLSFFAEARNLADKKYAATTGVISSVNPFNQAQFLPGDGRAFYGGVEWRW